MRTIIERNLHGERIVAIEESDLRLLGRALRALPSGHRDSQSEDREIKATRLLLLKLGATL